MTEYDTDPQRQPAAPEDRSAHTTAEHGEGAGQAAAPGSPTAPAAPSPVASSSAVPPAGAAGTVPDEAATQQLPTSDAPVAGTPTAGSSTAGGPAAGAPMAGAPYQPAPPSGPYPGQPPFGGPHQAPGGPQPQPPGGFQPMPGYPGGPASAPPYPGGSASAPPYPGGSASAPPYPGGSASAPPYPGRPASAPPYPEGSASAPAYPGGPQPPYPGGPQPGGAAGQPPWAQPVGGPPRPPSRFGKIAVTGVAALALALGSGVVGGIVATQFDDDGTPASISGNRTSGAAPVLQRDSLAGIADRVQPSVVSISTGNGEGSGVVLTADGYILTNNHVVASANGGRVSVVFSNGKTNQGNIVGTDARTDLAVVKIDDIDGLRPATFGDSSAMQVGDTVLALGSPLGLQGSVTAGIVSALDRSIQVGGEGQVPPSGGVQRMAGLLQTDAPINPGNSGGALVNLTGEVIGINTAIATSGQGQGNIGVGFAIPSNKAKQVAEQLKAGKEVRHPFLGVSVTNAEGGNGALVGTVQPGSPAAGVGLQKGDVITKLGDREINSSEDLVSAVQGGAVGDQLELRYVRNGEQKTATVKLAEAS